MTTKRKKAEAPTLDELIASVDALWNTEGSSGCYLYTIGRFKHGWTFNVTDSWHRWHAANRPHQFGPYPTPHDAVQAFMSYVKENGIDVAGLQD